MGTTQSKPSCAILDGLVSLYFSRKTELKEVFQSTSEGRNASERVLNCALNFYLNDMELLLIQTFLEGWINSRESGGYEWLMNADDQDKKGILFLINEAYFIFSIRKSLNLFNQDELKTDYVIEQLQEIIPQLENIFLPNISPSSSISTSTVSTYNRPSATTSLSTLSMFSPRSQSMIKTVSRQESKLIAITGILDTISILPKWKEIQTLLNRYFDPIIADEGEHRNAILAMFRSYEDRLKLKVKYEAAIIDAKIDHFDNVTRNNLLSMSDSFQQLDNLDLLRREESSLLSLIEATSIDSDEDSEFVEVLKRQLGNVRTKIAVLTSQDDDDEDISSTVPSRTVLILGDAPSQVQSLKRS